MGSRKDHQGALERVVVLVDMDCFYVQVEQRSCPETRGKPCAVVQYNQWKGGGIIAVSYEARARGVSRRAMRGDDAKVKCPDIHLFRVPEVRGKADLTRYREAGAEVIAVLSTFSDCVERASIDEAYIDLTQEVNSMLQSIETENVGTDQLPNTFIVGWDGKKEEMSEESEEKKSDSVNKCRAEGVSNWLNTILDPDDINIYDKRLALGAVVAERMREEVYKKTGFRCSAGIAHNKMLSKLACGINKPNRQTVLPHASVNGLFQTMPINKVRSLGGKFGQTLIQELQVENMADLCAFSEKKLQEMFGDKTGTWVYEVCRGLEYESVSARQLPKSIGCGKNFPGKQQLDTVEKVRYWLQQMAEEILERLEKDRQANKRFAKLLNVNIRQVNMRQAPSSRSCAIARYDSQKFADDALALVRKFNQSPAHQPTWSPGVVNLSIVASKFVDIADDNAVSSIKKFLSSEPSSTQSTASQYSTDLFSPMTQSKAPVNGKRNPKRGSIEGLFSQAIQNKKARTESFVAHYSEFGIPGETDELNESSSSFVEFSQLASTQWGSGQTQQNKVVEDFLHDKSVISIDTTPKVNTGKGFFATKTKQLQSSTSGKNQFVSTPGNSGQMTQNNIVQDVLEEKPVLSKFHDRTNESISEMKPGKGFFATKKKQWFELQNEKASQLNDALVDFNTSTQQNLPSCSYTQTSQNIQINSEKRMAAEAEINSVFNNGTERTMDAHCSNSAAALPPGGDESDYSTCDKCGQQISAWDLPEHLDYHIALDLQKEQTVTVTPRRNSNITGLKKSGKKKKSPAVPTLHSFFKKT